MFMKEERQKKGFTIKSIDWRRVKSVFNQRTLIMCAMLAVLVVTGALSIQYTRRTEQTAQEDATARETAQSQTQSDAQPTEETTETGSFFTDYRSERNSVRAQEVANLDSIIQNTATKQETLDEAQARKLELTDMMEKEVTVEGLLRAKGFSQAIVTLSPESVNVVVADASVTSQQAAQILQIVQNETGQPAQNVKIIPAG